MSVQENFSNIETVALHTARYLQPRLAAPAVSGARAQARPRAKRALDLFLAIPALILLSPVLLAVAFLMALDSRGPVLFRQTRNGQNGVPFDILKFRTMNVCENGPKIVQARRNDPRVTRIGRALRRSSLDELPQLINVISGEMSLIGPRPHALAHDQLYSTLIENYSLRQLAKPGISGWAQVNGHRGETPTVESMRARVEHDLWYAKNASLALDVEILVRTLFEIFRRINAY